LLIDEYETAIHPKAMDLVFDFLIKVCKERNIQVFMTTHSYEALEKMLQCESNSDDIRVITMLKNADRTTARVLDRDKAFYVRDELGLELR
jgi:AAA15 family ATPase/GTPase